ncbi:MAG: hypothetical protein FJX63_02435 [Alphaproteobacteria bacterium]|nr:hypothetical protein [Alphaproteobacteria bacterium]
MTAKHDRLSELCYAAEGLSGSASAAALRRVGSLASSAPVGRMFGAIATLTELSSEASQTLAEGGRLMAHGDALAARERLASAIDRLNRLAATAIPDLDIEPTERRKQG